MLVRTLFSFKNASLGCNGTDEVQIGDPFCISSKSGTFIPFKTGSLQIAYRSCRAYLH